MRPVLLAASALSPYYLKALAAHYEVIGPMPLAELQSHPAREKIKVIAASGESRIAVEVMDALPALQLISVMGVGYDGVNAAAAVQRGVLVTHTPDVLNDDVADLAIALMLNVTRRLVQADRYVREGHWSAGPMPLATKLSGLRLGIVGMGRIGQTIARRALAFDMPVAYTARTAKPELPYAYHASALALAAEVDVLVVITPGGAATRHMINAEVLTALGAGGYLVNVARGSVVDEMALVQALKAGTIAGAGLDVFENEPTPLPDLLTLPQVVLAPHVGSATTATRTAMAQLAADNIHKWLDTARVITPVPECQP